MVLPRACLTQPLIFLLAALLTLTFPPANGAQENSQTPAPSALPSAEALKSCMSSRSGAQCMDELFREALKKHWDGRYACPFAPR